ncbi:hypothetical protein GGI15_000022 [Coemansia interrupta]|uniref:NADH:flavin oxidoreductase/NADH oxidase N-terminal domain-containing protein n=1 Tax=Coemansia interrupta TaxID=1126814 RepID=A0A9W8HNT9_9FUNG|nr:hypothetical protein GGI15_000022 [Coemansia interrupta]
MSASASSDPHAFFQEQRGHGPGAAIEPTASEHNPSPLPLMFQPLTIRGLTLKNRLAVSPMCMYSSTDGFATDFHLVHTGQFTMRGLGLVIMEATGVSPEGRITPNCLGIWKDAHIEKLQQIVRFVHANKAAAGIQLAHAGRKASTTAPWLMKTLRRMRRRSLDKIRRIQGDFAQAAKRALLAGFDVIELHAAHGYLLHEFLSPISNKRTDEYGGSFDNRVRFLVETVRSVRKEWPQDRPLFVRLSVTDWVAPCDAVPGGGWTEEESVELASRLKSEGVDLVDCSTSGSSPLQKIPLAPGYQVRFAEDIRRQVKGMLTGAVGLITDAQQANDVLEQGHADMVFLSHVKLCDPNFVLNAATSLGTPSSSDISPGTAVPTDLSPSAASMLRVLLPALTRLDDTLESVNTKQAELTQVLTRLTTELDQFSDLVAPPSHGSTSQHLQNSRTRLSNINVTLKRVRTRLDNISLLAQAKLNK